MKISRLGVAALLSLVAACSDAPPAKAPTPTTDASAVPSAAPLASSAPAPVASSPEAPPAPASSMLDLQLALLRAYVHAFNAHDAKAVAALYAEDGVLVERGEWASSGDAVATNFQAFFDAFPDASTAITRSWHSGDSVLFEYVEGGTNTGKHRAHKPTGKKIGYVGASILVFKPDGKIKSDMTYSDELAREVQAGWAPSSLAKMAVRPVIPVPAASDTWEVHKATDSDADQQRVVATRKALYSSFSMRSEKDYLATLSDDVQLFPYDDPADASGKTQAASLFKSWIKTFAGGVLNANTAWAVDGYVVIQGTFTGKQTGAWGPVKATNKTFKSQFLDITRVDKSGKVDRMWTYANNYELLLQLGYHKVEAVDDKQSDPVGIF